MNQLQLFLPCAAGVEDFLAQEVHEITGLQGEDLRVMRGGVNLRSSWRDAMRLNLYSRLCQRVLVQLHVGEYRNEQDLYKAASDVAWEIWFTPKESFKIEITAQHSPLQSLNFAALKIKDAIADRFRFKTGIRPDVNTQWPDARIYAHLTTDTVTFYIDTSGDVTSDLRRLNGDGATAAAGVVKRGKFAGFFIDGVNPAAGGDHGGGQGFLQRRFARVLPPAAFEKRLARGVDVDGDSICR